MATEIKVPELGESVVEATVGEWLVQEGDSVNIGDVIVSLETDKVDVEVGAEAAGVISRIARQSGADVAVGEVLGYIEANGSSADGSEQSGNGQTTGSAPTAVASPAKSDETKPEPIKADAGERATPVAKRMAAEKGIDLAQISGSGSSGKITKQDVTAHLDKQQAPAPPQTKPEQPAAQPAASDTVPRELAQLFGREEREERSRMSRRRRTIASRLVEAQQTAAMLTTFNEVDMSAVINLRKRRQEAFVARHGVKVGFMSFFVKAAVGALKAFPRLNAELDGDEMVLKNYYDIGMAVGAEEGLVVPVLRDADRLSFAEIEKQIKNYAQKAQNGTLTLADLQGGTFTITNGGVFGSMLSTPILNPPQVGILGLHNIVERPVAIDGQVVIRPIMYVALTYDHRIVDGREAVQFLVRVKELIEDPENLLLEG